MIKKKILTVFGTRPEVIKLAPFIKAVEEHDNYISVTCATTQHKELQNDVLNLFDIKADYDLDVMRDNQDLFYVTQTIMKRIQGVLQKEQPDYVVVQGDTTTAFVGALSAFYLKIPVVHIEAGLRTSDVYSPFPEEINRSLISKLATYHMAPTDLAIVNLQREGVEKNVFHAGNTIVDAVHYILQQPLLEKSPLHKVIQNNAKKVLITLHRRENFGDPLHLICDAIKQIAQEYPDVDFIWPVHPNPNVKDYIYKKMGTIHNVKLITPIGYNDLIYLLNACAIVLSDSGGIQEEACILGKKIIILRETTERPEVVNAGFGTLCGSNKQKIIETFASLMEETTVNKINKEIYGKIGVSKRILSVFKEVTNAH